MTAEARQGWREDPYRRHELRYWDGLAWSAHVSDVGVRGDDPVFPVVDADPLTYLAPRPRRRRRRLPGLDRAAAWAVSGFVGVIGLAVASAMGGVPAAPVPPVAVVAPAVADVPPGDPGWSQDDVTTAAAALETLPVKPADKAATPRPRQSGWQDVDRDGCDVRNDILRRDLADVRLETTGCTVVSGTLADPWTGAAVALRAGAPANEARRSVQVASVVAPGAAWRTGAGTLSDGDRRALDNDPLNLQAVSASTMRARGQADAAGWLPPTRSARCGYVARQIAVKARYGLWVTAAERAAMQVVLATCPGQPLPTVAAGS